MPLGPASRLNLAACQADFTYAMIVNVIKIQKLVAEDLEAGSRILA
jgi:hypothetical protein